MHVALLPHHIYPSPFHLFIRSRAMFTPQRKQKNTSHLAHTKRVVGAFVSKATSCYIFCAMYTSLLCACSYVVLSIFFPSFSLFSPCHCRIHLKPIFFPSHSSLSFYYDVDHKKAVFTFNIFNPPIFYMFFSPNVASSSYGVRDEEKLFFCHFTFQIGKAWMDMCICGVHGV